MEQHLLKNYGVFTPNNPAVTKRRKLTVMQILKEAYRRHCRDRATREALRHHLR